MTVEIRAANGADLPAVRALLVETWHATYDPIHGAQEVTDITNRWHAIKVLASQLNRADAAFLLAERNRKIVATSLAILQSPGALLLSRLYVHPSQQRCGIGLRLLEATLAPFPDARLIKVEVDPQNERAIRFYERHGFALAAPVKTSTNAPESEVLVFERRREQRRPT